MIACFKPQKSPLDFVRVAKIVSDEIGEARFLLVGDGMLRPKVEELIRELLLNRFLISYLFLVKYAI